MCVKALSKCLVFFVFFIQTVNGQNLFTERIRKVKGKKISLYVKSGVIHNGVGQIRNASVKAMRHSSASQRGFERIVIDFTTAQVPRFYGHIAGDNKNISLDFFSTEILKTFKSYGKSKHVKSIDVFPLGGETLTMEINFKSKVTVDAFYLDNPARLVFDVRAP